MKWSDKPSCNKTYAFQLKIRRIVIYEIGFFEKGIITHKEH